MISIDTAQKDWQKRMEASMSKKEKFLLITTDKKLAKSLEKNEFNTGVLKLILFDQLQLQLQLEPQQLALEFQD